MWWCKRYVLAIMATPHGEQCVFVYGKDVKEDKLQRCHASKLSARGSYFV